MSAELFERAYRCLSAVCSAEPDGSTTQTAVAAAEDAEAVQLLEQLDYLARRGPATAASPTAVGDSERENRLALLKLASRLERIIRLPSAQAPGGYFLGSELSPERFGLSCPDGSPVSASGRGQSLAAAFESCVGEGAEYISVLEWGCETRCFAPISSGPLLGVRHREEHLDWLLGGVGFDRKSLGEKPIEWVGLRSLSDAEDLPVPLDLCLRRANPPFRKAESSGCAAGPSLEAAKYAALMELVERDAVALWWYGGAPAGPLSLDDRVADQLEALSEDVRQQAERRHWFLDITSDIGIPAVAALSSRLDGGAVICGFAADVDPLEAARKALLELCQMELAEDIVNLRIDEQGMENLMESDRRFLKRMAQLQVGRFSQFGPGRAALAWPPCAQIALVEKLGRSVESLRTRGLEAYWLDLTRPEIGLAVARVVVPNLQSINVSWTSNRLKIATQSHNYGVVDYLKLPPII